jgi:hypothetical protein
MNAAVPRPVPLALRLVEAVAKLRPTLKLQVAAGYQDERGFHYGVKPAEKKICWPPRLD